MSTYTVKMGKTARKFDELSDAIAFAQKESWDKARPARVIKPDGKIMEINITSK